MKKIYTSLACISMFGMACFAQTSTELPIMERMVNTSKSAEHPLHVTQTRASYINSNSASSERGGLVCAFNEDFESGFPAGWTNITNNPNENWTYETTGGNPDGHLNIAYDGPPPGQQNESILTSLIDLTTIPDPTLKFDWFMSYYWGVDPNDNYDLTISISTDGINWTNLWTEADHGGEFTSYEWYTTNVDLSAYATLSAAILRFNYNGFDGAQAKLDNISVCSAQNDLRVNMVLAGDILNDYAYSQIPVSQASEVIAGAIFSNVGGTTLTNISLDASTFSFVAAADVSTATVAGPASLAPAQSDTVWVATGYVPSMEDTLAQTFVASSTETDDAPLDNEGVEFLLVTQDTWAHDYEFEDYYAYGYASGEFPGSGGFEMGAAYFCQTSGGTLYAVDFPLGSNTTAQSITIRIYENSLATGLVSSTLYDIQSGDLSTTSVNFINVPLDVPVSLIAGNVYTATIAIEGGDDAYILGNNMDDGDGGHVLYSADNDQWYNWTGLTTAMRLRVSSVVGVEENNGLTSLQVYPNPVSDNINVSFVSEENDVVSINVIGVDGKLVDSTTRTVVSGQQMSVAFDPSKLATGVYSIQILGDNISTVQRIIVQ